METDFKRLYKMIIDNAIAENRKKHHGLYFERHHIVPEFMFKNRSRKGPAGHLSGNPNDPTNLVLLTFKEHLLAHYYLYEILKDTRYVHSAGSALQFFFTHATGNHQRQRNLTDADEEFLKEMSKLRQLGIQSISNAKKGKMPAVDSVTGETIGLVGVSHPKVISREWVHHSLGKKSPKSGRNQQGSNNANYKHLDEKRKTRIFKCVHRSIKDNRFVRKIFLDELKEEFTEFKSVSMVWIINHFKSVSNLINEFNEVYQKNVSYDPYYRSPEMRRALQQSSSGYAWITDGNCDIRVPKDKLITELEARPTYYRGRK